MAHLRCFQAAFSLRGGGGTPLRAELLQAAEIALNGVVSDVDDPIIGASVSEKGNAGSSVATYVDGRFTIRGVVRCCVGSVLANYRHSTDNISQRGMEEGDYIRT